MWFSYRFHSQLCEPFSEGLFDPFVHSINHPKQSITLSGSQPVIQLAGPSVNRSLSQSIQLAGSFFHHKCWAISESEIYLSISWPLSAANIFYCVTVRRKFESRQRLVPSKAAETSTNSTEIDQCLHVVRLNLL